MQEKNRKTEYGKLIQQFDFFVFQIVDDSYKADQEEKFLYEP